MTHRWTLTTIGESCVVTSGGTPSRTVKAYWIGDIPWVSAKDLKSERIGGAELHISADAVERSATKIAPVGSLLVLVRGMGLANGVPIGEVISPVAFNQDIRAIHPPKELLPRFLLLAIKSRLVRRDGDRVLSSAAHGTLKIDSEVLRNIAVPIPPIREQKRIVDILDQAFGSIEKIKANAEKSLVNAKELRDALLDQAFDGNL